MRVRRRWAWACGAALLALGCAGAQEGDQGLFGGSLARAVQCSPAGQNSFVFAVMNEYYLWYREIPPVEPLSYGSPEEYLEAIRYRPLDSSFSYITGKEEQEAFFSESQFVGFGFSMQLVSSTELRVTDAFPGSPAAEAGLARGVWILEVNGRSIADLVRTNQLGSAFGPAEVGVRVTLRYRALDGSVRTVEMVKRVVTIPTVSATRTFASGGRTVGYISFKNFVEPSTAALDAAFAQLAAAGASELVLDVRYNGGGLISVAQHLAGLIGGTRTSGQVLIRFVHNDKNTGRDRSLTIANPPSALNLRRLVVITTRSSASASELMVNGLRPYMEVVIVGAPTFGKPVGQYSFDFCDKVLVPVSFFARNARNDPDYFGGLPPDCPAADDLDHPLGDPREASLAEALRYIATGSCSAAAAAGARAQAAGRPAEPRQPHREDGWRQLVGAY